MKVYAKTIEDEALEQINTLLSQDAFKDCKVRIMPDVHAGKGCVIGFTADLGNKVIPNIVGVDIGCGMLCVSLGHRDFNAVTLNTLDRVIRTYVPSGKNVHDGRQMRFEELKELYCYRELKDTKRLERSIGTLGGGNHFIEVDVAEDGYKYLIIHTGSRNLGKQVADYYQNLAYELMCGKDDLYDRQEKLIADYKAAGRKSEIESAIKELRRNFRAVTPKLPKDLCYLEGKYREQYLHDMRICQKFAYMNRVMIAQIICNHMGWGVDADMPDFFECIHNYIDHDSNIVRKGAISAKYGEKVLIPINMRDGIILGTGLGSLANEITEKYEIKYSDIPNFPISTVEGHSGKLIFGKLGNKDIMAMQGRFHYYEGYSMKEVTFPVRVMRELGIKTLFVSNAAGGTNPDFEIGDLMIITDHINLFPEHPLRGKNIEYGPRFPDMSEAYSKELIAKALEIAQEKGIKVQQGVYLGTQGPTFETPSEYKMFHILGADAVGMSTVPEVIVANHCGIKVFGVSVITDLGVEGKIVEVSHEEVQKAADEAQPRMTTIMRELINRA